MFQRLLRVVFAIEFLLAIMAVFTVWREVGGSGHLDSMHWYWKAVIGLPAAYAFVRLTVAWVDTAANRRRRMLAWLIVLGALIVAAGLLTYYTHLNEPLDEDEEDPGTITPAAVYRGLVCSHSGILLESLRWS